MEDNLQKRILERAKKIFEAGPTGDEVWGTTTPDGKTAFAMKQGEGREPPQAKIISPEKRQRYVDQAIKEMKSEGLI